MTMLFYYDNKAPAAYSFNDLYQKLYVVRPKSKLTPAHLVHWTEVIGAQNPKFLAPEVRSLKGS
jgi:hypothetical protein